MEPSPSPLLLLLLLLLILLLVSISAINAASPTDFIRASCGATRYPALCPVPLLLRAHGAPQPTPARPRRALCQRRPSGAALTDESTCLDGLHQRRNSDDAGVRAAIRKKMGRLKLFVGDHFSVEGNLKYKGGVMHLWRVSADDFSYEDLVDCIHEMEFGRVKKMHYRVPNSNRGLDTSLIILHSEESFRNISQYLKENIPIEVYVEHVIDDVSSSNMPNISQEAFAATNNITYKSFTEQVGSVHDVDTTVPSNPFGLQSGEEEETQTTSKNAELAIRSEEIQPSLSSDLSSSKNCWSTSDDDEYVHIKKKRKEMEGFRVTEQQPKTVAAKGKGKTCHSVKGKGKNIDSGPTNKSKKAQDAAATKSKGKTAMREKNKAKVVTSAKCKRKTIHVKPSGKGKQAHAIHATEVEPIQKQDNAQAPAVAAELEPIQEQDKAQDSTVAAEAEPIHEQDNTQASSTAKGKGKRKVNTAGIKIEGKKKSEQKQSEHIGAQTKRSKVLLKYSGMGKLSIDTPSKESGSSKKRQQNTEVNL
ncbi:hypothetical protein J5N97_025495 [Dioscorea zingiberensis]|uniref:PB1-like domain-containing protein n=1 Tax=Dioscorea zingiberensis TaxID=325984 RepID=A0A9D5C957_9LILI|nr:hypothetical protein J5N97_025495 [Dioscorea zingiberensis]